VLASGPCRRPTAVSQRKAGSREKT